MKITSVMGLTLKRFNKVQSSKVTELHNCFLISEKIIDLFEKNTLKHLVCDSSLP